MQSPHLIDAHVLRGRFNNWFMRLVYSYEDEKGVHKVIFPKVDFPFPTFSIPELCKDNSMHVDYSYSGARIMNNPDTFIAPLPIVKLQQDTDRLAKSRGVDTPEIVFDSRHIKMCLSSRSNGFAGHCMAMFAGKD